MKNRSKSNAPALLVFSVAGYSETQLEDLCRCYDDSYAACMGYTHALTVFNAERESLTVKLLGKLD